MQLHEFMQEFLPDYEEKKKDSMKIENSMQKKDFETYYFPEAFDNFLNNTSIRIKVNYEFLQSEPNKILVCKALMAYLGCGLTEAKSIVGNVQSIYPYITIPNIYIHVSKENIEQIKICIENLKLPDKPCTSCVHLHSKECSFICNMRCYKYVKMN